MTRQPDMHANMVAPGSIREAGRPQSGQAGARARMRSGTARAHRPPRLERRPQRSHSPPSAFYLPLGAHYRRWPASCRPPLPAVPHPCLWGAHHPDYCSMCISVKRPHKVRLRSDQLCNADRAFKHVQRVNVWSAETSVRPGSGLALCVRERLTSSCSRSCSTKSAVRSCANAAALELPATAADQPLSVLFKQADDGRRVETEANECSKNVSCDAVKCFY